MTDPTICDVFDRLDKWRHFPNYQLERRADIYFAVPARRAESGYGPCQIFLSSRCATARLGTDKESTGKGGIGANSVSESGLRCVHKGPSSGVLCGAKDGLQFRQPTKPRLKKAKGLESRKLADGIDYIIGARPINFLRGWQQAVRLDVEITNV